MEIRTWTWLTSPLGTTDTPIHIALAPPALALIATEAPVHLSAAGEFSQPTHIPPEAVQHAHEAARHLSAAGRAAQDETTTDGGPGRGLRLVATSRLGATTSEEIVLGRRDVEVIHTVRMDGLRVSVTAHRRRRRRERGIRARLHLGACGRRRPGLRGSRSRGLA